jgi:zinc transporter ZupT
MFPLSPHLAALGLMIYMILDRAVVLHPGGNEGMGSPRNRGRLGAGGLSIHSFFDGMAIGLAFQASTSAGVIVAIAVLVHDFSDGINTVSLVLKDSGTRGQALRWLLVDAAAPLLGVSSTLLFNLTRKYPWFGAGDLLRFLSLYRRERSLARKLPQPPNKVDYLHDTPWCCRPLCGD